MTAPLPAPTRPGRAGGSGLTVRPWIDPVIDRLGLPPRSSYVEEFWLPLLGPTATWLVRRLAAGLEVQPDGYLCSASQLAASLGLGRDGRSRTLIRALQRASDFGLVRLGPGGTLAVRRRFPPLALRQVARLPAAWQVAHAAWQTADAPWNDQDDRAAAAARRMRDRHGRDERTGAPTPPGRSRAERPPALERPAVGAHGSVGPPAAVPGDPR